MTREERKLSIEYLEGINDEYIEHFDIDGVKGTNAMPEYYAIENAINALAQIDKIAQIIDDCDLEAWEALEMIKEVVRK